MITTGIDKRVQVQQLIDNQLPEFILSESPKTADFLKQYYIGQEYRGGPIDISDNLDQYLKLDNLTPEVVTGRTALSAGITTDATTISVDSTKGFPNQYGLFKIDDEIITYTGLTTNSFTGCVRGFSGITTYHAENAPGELVFSTSSTATHENDAVVVNLSTLFLQEFYKKLKVTLTPGLENVDFVSNLDVSNFIKEARTFYEAKGTEESFRILFQVLYGADPKVIDLEEFLIKPSSAKYIRRERIVAEKLSGDPIKLTGQTVFNSKDSQTSASISEVELVTGIPGATNEYYALDIFVGYDDEEYVTGTFNVPGKTRVIGDVSVGSSVITVDSTVGFGATGVLVAGNSTAGINTNIVYTDKTINQFLGISTTGSQSIQYDISYGNDCRSDEIIYGYEGGDTTKDKIELRITGVLSEFISESQNRLSLEGETILVKSIGEKIEDNDLSRKQINANSWIYNTSTVSEIDDSIAGTTGSFDLKSKTNRTSLRVGDTVGITSRTSNPLDPEIQIEFLGGDTTATVNAISGDGFNVSLSDSFDALSGVDYNLRRVLNKASSTSDVTFKYGNNSLTADIQNVYNENDEYLYVATNGLPSYPITKNIAKVGISSAIVGDTIQGYNSTTRKYSIISFSESNIPFITGDEVYYTPGTIDGTNALEGISEGVYFVQNVDFNKIKLYTSASSLANPSSTSVEFTVKDITGSVFVPHTFTLLRHYNQQLHSQELLKKYPIDANLQTGKGTKTLPGPIGMMINGVEIENYKSSDSVFYGPLEKFSVITGGEGYDIINPPSLEIEAGAGTTALVRPVISGHLREIQVDPQNFDIEDVLSVRITGGNSGKTILRPVIKKRNRVLEFDGRLIGNGGDVDTVNETLRFSNDHNLESGQALVYNRNGFPALGIGTFKGSDSADYETLEDGAVYYPQVLGISSIFLYKDESDYNAGINTIGFTNVAKTGIHKFTLKNAKNTLNSIAIVDPGDLFVNRKIYVKSTGISTYTDTIIFENHGFEDGESIVYSGGETADITGLSTSIEYKVIKLDNDSFRIANAGVGGTITANYDQNNYTKFTTKGSGLQTFNYPDITVTAEVVYSAGITTETVKLTPVIDGQIIDAFLYEEGTSYGTENLINYHNRPEITLKNGIGRADKDISPAIVPIIENGKVVKIRIDSGGDEYYSTPNLSVEGDGYSAKIRPIIDRNVGSDTYLKIVDTVILNGGSGYSTSKTSIKVTPAGKNAIFDTDIRKLSLCGIQSTRPYNVRYTDEVITQSVHGLRYAVVGYSTDVGKEYFGDLTGGHSPIIGWAYDGNPIYGPYGYTDAFDSTTVSLLRPSYSLDVSKVENRPGITTFAAGTFAEDYSYDASGDLDEHNGRYCITPQYPDGVYAYFVGVNTASTGKLEPVFPYFIGHTYRSLPVVLDPEDQITQSFDFNASDLVRNTFPYKASDKFASTYFIESDDIVTQSSIVEAVSQGDVESLDIIKSGDNYKAGDSLVFDDTGTNGNGLSAIVKTVESPELSVIETEYTSFTGVQFTWKDANKISAYFTEPSELAINTPIIVSGLSTAIKNLDGNHIIGITTENTVLYKEVALNGTAGIITDIYVGRTSDLISVGSTIGIGTETLSVLNKFEDRNILRVKRGVTGTAHTVSTEVKLIPRTITLPIKTDYFESKLDDVVYFNPTQSFGLGGVAGVSTSVYVSVGETASQVSVPTQSLYLPKHPFKTGQLITLTKAPSGGNIGVSTDGSVVAGYSIPISGTSQDLYVINKSEDYIGITTQLSDLRSTTGNLAGGLFFLSATTNSFEYTFESNLTQVTGTVEKIDTTVSVSTNHNLLGNDVITLSLKPDQSVGIGTSAGVTLKYNALTEKLLVNPVLFTSAGVNTSTDILTINSHHFKTGDKVFYTTGVGVTDFEAIEGVTTNSSYFVYRIDDNNIQLADTHFDATKYPPQIKSLVSVGGTAQELSSINPQIHVVRDNDLVFDVSDTSLSGYEFNLYYDSDFGNKFVSIGSSSVISVARDGTVGSGVTATVTLKYNKDNPLNLFYNLEKSGFISTSDIDVKNGSKILYTNSDYEGTYSVAGIGSTTFTIQLDKKPESLRYDSSTTDTFKYSTNSPTARGPLSELKINFAGVGYKQMPKFVSIASTQGTNAEVLPRSSTANQIKDVSINNIGFEYASDKTLLPIARLSPVISLKDYGVLKSLEVVNGGKGFLSNPTIVVIDKITREVNTSGYLQPNVSPSTQSIESIDIISAPKGLNIPELITVDNTNGVSVTNVAIGDTIVTDTQSGIVTVTLGTPIIGFTTAPFKIGDEFFVEGFENEYGNTFNSASNGYKFFTVTNTYISKPSALTLNPYQFEFNIKDIANNPGLTKTNQTFASVVNKNKLPEFTLVQEAAPFIEGENILVMDADKIYQDVGLKLDKISNDYIKLIGQYDLKVNDKIKGTYTGSLASINTLYANTGEFKVDYSSKKTKGWFNNVGKLDEDYQVIPDNDYYQNLSYTIQSPIEYKKLVSPVNRLLHTAGLKNFADTGITSTSSSGLSTAVDATTITRDLTSDRRVDIINNFDLVADVDTLTNPERSKYIRFSTKELVNYFKCETNNVLEIDNINTQFSNASNNIKTDGKLELTNTFGRFLVQATVPTSIMGGRTKDSIQLTEVITNVDFTNKDVYTIQKGSLFGDQVVDNQTGLVNIIGDVDFNDLYSLKFEPTDIYTTDLNIKIYETSLVGSGVGTTSFGFVSLEGFSEEVSAGTVSGPTTAVMASANINNLDSYFASVEVHDTYANTNKITELYVTHDGTNSYISSYDFETTTSDAIGTFTSSIDSGILSLKFENDNTSNPVSVKSKIVGIGTTAAGIGTYRFNTSAQPAGSERSLRVQSSYNRVSAAATILEFDKNTVSSASNIIRVSIGNTSAIHQVIMAHDTTDALYMQYPFISIGSTSGNIGLGTFTAQLNGNDFELVFHPDASGEIQVQTYSEVINSGFDLINVAPDHVYGPAIDELSLLQYDALNGSRSDNRNFVLNHDGLPIFARYFNPSETDSFIPGTGTFNLTNNFFNANERLVYTPGSSIEGIGTGRLLMSDGNPLPEEVYVKSSLVNSDSFQLSLTRDSSGVAGAAVTFIDYPYDAPLGIGTGNYHRLEMFKKNSKTLITLDNVIQSPLAYTPITTTLSGNVSGQVGVSTDIITLAGISSILLNDILEIDNGSGGKEFVKVKNVGLGITNKGPITETGSLKMVEVERGFVGTAATIHDDGDTVRLYKGAYNIVGDRIYFSEAPRGQNETARNRSNRDAGRSSFSGRVYLRQDYRLNKVYDDISNEFTGIAQTFTTLVSGVNTTGITTGSTFLTMNGIFQRPTTAENPLNNYDFIENSTVGVTSFVFSGITSTNGALIVLDDKVNQNQLPRAGQIISIGSSGGLGIAPLVGAYSTAVTNTVGTITGVGIGSTDFQGSGYNFEGSVSIGVTDVAYDHRFISAGVNSITVNPNGIGAYSTLTPTDATFKSDSGELTLIKEDHGLITSDSYTATTGTFYDGTVGILTVKLTASPSPALAVGQIVNITDGGLTFTCAEDSNASNHPYPRSTDYMSDRWVPITAVSGGDTFEINVLEYTPSSNTTTHAWVSALPNSIKRSANTVGIATTSMAFKCSSDYYKSTQYYPRLTDEANGAWLNIKTATSDSITVGVGSAGGGGTGAVITATVIQGNAHTYVSGLSSSILVDDTTYYSPYSIGGLGNEYDPVSGILTVTVDNAHGMSAAGLQTATNAVYDPVVGIITITTNGAHGYSTGNYVKIEENSLTFTCAQDGDQTQHTYPRSSDPIFNKWIQIQNASGSTFEIQVLDSAPSTNTSVHTFVSGTVSGIQKANNVVAISTNAFTFTCDQDNNTSEHSYPRENKLNPGSDPAYKATIGVESVGTTTSFTLNVGKSPAHSGGGIKMTISDGGKGYVNPRILTPSPSYENLNIQGLTRLGLGSTTETGNALRLGINVGASSTTGIGSISYEVKDFDITRSGFGFRKGDTFVPLGIVTDRYFSSLLTPLEFSVNQVFTDKFGSWNVGEFDYIDDITNLQDGVRKRFPLNYKGELVSFQRGDDASIDLQALLLIFINGVMQVPGEAYIFGGGTSFVFTEAPDEYDDVSIFFYKGTNGVDVTYTDVVETLKSGDDVEVNKKNYLSGSVNQEKRTISGISTSDQVETNLYFGRGIDEDTLRPLTWLKQKVDKTINGNVVSKARPSIEPLVFPNARVIGDLTAVDTEVFLDSTELFNYENKNIGALIVNENQTLTGAALTANVSAGGTVSSVTIVNGGSGFSTTTVPVSFSAPGVKIAAGVGTTATATATITNGSIASIHITNPGLGYVSGQEPEVIAPLPVLQREIVTNIEPVNIKGFSGIVTGITTAFGSGGTGTLALKFFLEKETGDFTTLLNGYPIYVYNTSIGTGVTSIDGTAPGGNAAVVGIGTTYLDNIYYVRSINRSANRADFIADVDSNSTSIIGIGTTGEGSGNFSWGRLSGFSRGSNPISIGVTSKTVNVGLTTFPRVQRRNVGIRNTGALNDPA